jgi:indole-3-glycerol phosphate synthase
MNILETIALAKRHEVEERKETMPASFLEKSINFSRLPLSLTRFLSQPDASGIIAEFKRKSPSKGILNPNVTVEGITTGYASSGASALSVLTDVDFFGGSNNDLIKARELNSIPILRKDFIVDPYQVIEAKSIGADVILLIAAILTQKEVSELSNLARDLGMETILEVHSLKELGHRSSAVDIIGVNNRNLADFKVDLGISFDFSREIGDDTFISESGIHSPKDIVSLREAGYSGFLIGEHFMVTEDPAETCRNFVSTIKKLDKC